MNFNASIPVLKGVKYELTKKHFLKKRAMSLNTNHCCRSTPQTALIHAPTDQEKHTRDSIKTPRPPKMIAWSCKSHSKARVDEEWFCGLPASPTAWHFLWLSETWRVIDSLLPQGGI